MAWHWSVSLNFSRKYQLDCSSRLFDTHANIHTHMRTTGGLVVQNHTKWCDAGTMLSTIDECSNAKTLLDPGADAVKVENNKMAPKGCSRHKGAWYFNMHAEGILDGVSEPVCKTTAGKQHEVAHILRVLCCI